MLWDQFKKLSQSGHKLSALSNEGNPCAVERKVTEMHE